MSLNLDFKVQKEQKVRKLKILYRSTCQSKRDTRKLLWKPWNIVFWPEEKSSSDVDEGDLYFVRRSFIR